MRFRLASEQDEAHITRLVDGSLADDAPEAADALASEPEVQRQVASQRRVAGALRSGGPAVSDQLESAIDARIREAYGPDPHRTARKRRRSMPDWRPRRPAVSVARLGALCAVVVVVALVITLGGDGGGPSIATAAKLAFAPATSPAPATTSARFLDVSYAGVTYPSYARFSVTPIGVRTDRIGGRSTLTVFYRLHSGARMSYTVFSGKPVGLPGDARAVAYDGITLRAFRTRQGLAVVTLVRFDRTCVLAAPTNLDTVLGLAAAPIREQRTA